MNRWLTPDPVGPMPKGIRYWAEDTKKGATHPEASNPRLDFHYTIIRGDDDPLNSRKVTIVKEVETGEVFELRRSQPCGSACMCASRVTWLPKWEA